jgi:hypothetical protein
MYTQSTATNAIFCALELHTVRGLEYNVAQGLAFAESVVQKLHRIARLRALGLTKGNWNTDNSPIAML